MAYPFVLYAIISISTSTPSDRTKTATHVLAVMEEKFNPYASFAVQEDR